MLCGKPTFMDYFLYKHADQTQLDGCSIAMLNPGWIHMKRKMENVSVLIIGKKNSTLIDDEGNELEVKPGRMILLPANRLHKGIKAIENPVSYYWFHFYQRIQTDEEIRYFIPRHIEEKEAQTILSNKTIAFERLKDGILLPQMMDLKNPLQITNLCNEILSEVRNPGFSSLISKNLFINLLIELGKETFEQQEKEQKSDSGNSLVNKTLLMLEDELSNPNASVKYFADKLNVNPDYLGRCFKTAMHISIGQYISRRRVELSCTRLRETSDSIEEIVVQCGFGSRRQFYDEFKQHTNKTPASYRAESAFVGVNSL